MKLIIVFFLLIFLCLVGFSQKPNDIIDSKNINLKLLTELITKKCNIKRIGFDNEPLNYDKVAYDAAKYQCDYLSDKNFGISHYNSRQHNGVLLQTPNDRVFYFNKKNKDISDFDGEIINMVRVTELTYDSLSTLVIQSFMDSEGHRFIMTQIKSFKNIKCYGVFAVTYNYITKMLYVTGVFTSKYEK